MRMSYFYYKRDTEEIIKTKTFIPVKMLERKRLLPVVDVVKKYAEGSSVVRTEGVYEFDDRVERVQNKFIHVKTIDELKLDKIKALRSYVDGKLPSYDDRVDYLIGWFSEVRTNEIKADFVIWRDWFNSWSDKINATVSEKDIRLIDFRTPDDIQKALDEELLMNPVMVEK